jgi:hypothetical protein
MSTSEFPSFWPSVSFRMPGGGDVWMDYSPWTNWGVSSTTVGSPQIESGIFHDVALPGKQLGKLISAVVGLATILKNEGPDILVKYPEEAEALKDLVDLGKQIDVKKMELKKSIESEATDALSRLEKADARAYKALVENLHAQVGKGG